MNFRNLGKGAHIWTFENIGIDGGTRHEHLGKKRLHFLT